MSGRGIFVFRRRFCLRHKRYGLINIPIVLIILAFISLIVFVFIEKQLSPTIFAIAEARARILATEAINKAVNEKISSNVQYKDLITIHKNASGQISLIQVNTIEINRLETETTLEVVKTLQDITMERIKIPLGMITGSKILANFGPTIKVSLYPVGTVYVNTIEAFEEAGINQTRHRIMLDINAEIKIVQPFLSSIMLVKTDVPIAETIIVGNVPQAILDFKSN
ncbi:MAG TPA: sporulation protein YunB [Thermoanaerobacterales bacterium]|nr:sporulation protein YunB [Thermoanaerobacterales bacterium]